jgi:hypothetical protein
MAGSAPSDPRGKRIPLARLPELPAANVSMAQRKPWRHWCKLRSRPGISSLQPDALLGVTAACRDRRFETSLLGFAGS